MTNQCEENLSNTLNVQWFLDKIPFIS